MIKDLERQPGGPPPVGDTIGVANQSETRPGDPTSIPGWFEGENADCAELVLRAFEEDFRIFGYSEDPREWRQRPTKVPPILPH